MQRFSTAVDNQRIITVTLYRGSTESLQDDTLLGRFDIVDIAPAPRAMPLIAVTFSVSRRGTVSLAAENRSSTIAVKIKRVRSTART